jgi:hypothetical protein
MADRVHATVDAVQASARGTVRGAALSETQSPQLGEADDAVLARGEVRQPRIEARWFV